jgi:hypothetical protein
MRVGGIAVTVDAMGFLQRETGDLGNQHYAKLVIFSFDLFELL